jgi:hypothetical protein
MHQSIDQHHRSLRERSIAHREQLISDDANPVAMSARVDGEPGPGRVINKRPVGSRLTLGCWLWATLGAAPGQKDSLKAEGFPLDGVTGSRMTGPAADGERTPSKHTMILHSLHVSLPQAAPPAPGRINTSVALTVFQTRKELVLLHFVRCQALTPTPLNKEPSKCGQPALIAHSSVATALAGCLNQHEPTLCRLLASLPPAMAREALPLSPILIGGACNARRAIAGLVSMEAYHRRPHLPAWEACCDIA